MIVDGLLRLVLPGGARILAYADDITLSVSHRDPATAVAILQEALSIVKSWLVSVKLTMNAAKTVLMIFSKRKVPLPDLSLDIDGFTVRPSWTAKLLGVTIDSQLKWREHLAEREVKFKRTVFTMRRYLGRTWGLNRHRLKTLYKAVAEPLLLYACSVWSPIILTKRGLKRIRAVERSFNIMMSRSFKTTGASSLSIIAGTTPVDYRIREIVLRRHFLGDFASFSMEALQTVTDLIPALFIKFKGRIKGDQAEPTPPWSLAAEVDMLAGATLAAEQPNRTEIQATPAATPTERLSSAAPYDPTSTQTPFLPYPSSIVSQASVTPSARSNKPSVLTPNHVSIPVDSQSTLPTFPNSPSVQSQLLLLSPPSTSRSPSFDNSISRNVARATIRRFVLGKWDAEWRDSCQGVATRGFFPGPDCVGGIRDRWLSFQVVQVVTGHSFLNDYQHRLGFRGDPLCMCGRARETREHYLFHCTRFSDLRGEFVAASVRLIGMWPPPVSSIHKFGPVFREMARFVVATGRLDGPGGRV